jgi:hypothetical protein
MISLDVTHLIVAGVALLGPVVLRRLQALAAPQPATPAPPPAVPPDLAALLPLHGLVLQLALQLLRQQIPAPQPQLPK